MHISRRGLLGTAASLPLVGAARRRGRKAPTR